MARIQRLAQVLLVFLWSLAFATAASAPPNSIPFKLTNNAGRYADRTYGLLMRTTAASTSGRNITLYRLEPPAANATALAGCDTALLCYITLLLQLPHLLLHRSRLYSFLTLTLKDDSRDLREEYHFIPPRPSRC